jgi:hypothetical protein
MKTTLLIALLLGFLGIATAWAIWVWVSVGDVQMSSHGWTALVLMVVFSLLVGVGLMGLVFYSARHGYDEPPDPDR